MLGINLSLIADEMVLRRPVCELSCFESGIDGWEIKMRIVIAKKHLTD